MCIYTHKYARITYTALYVDMWIHCTICYIQYVYIVSVRSYYILQIARVYIVYIIHHVLSGMRRARSGFGRPGRDRQEVTEQLTQEPQAEVVAETDLDSPLRAVETAQAGFEGSLLLKRPQGFCRPESCPGLPPEAPRSASSCTG